MKLSADEFARHAASLCDPDLSEWWRRANFSNGFEGTSDALADAAYAALVHWAQTPFDERESLQSQGVQGAGLAFARCLESAGDESFAMTRRFGRLFHSTNIGVAFCAIRLFDNYLLTPYTMFVIDHLVQVASAAEVPVSPGVMSLRAIAFKVLYDLDANFLVYPSLARACEECIFGCREWSNGTGARAQEYGDTLLKLLKYRPRKPEI